MRVYFVAGELDLQWNAETGFSDWQALKVLPEAQGVWVFDRPVIPDGVGPRPYGGFTCVTVDADPVELSKYELPPSPAGYRQWRVPAAILNRCPRTTFAYEP